MLRWVSLRPHCRKPTRWPCSSPGLVTSVGYGYSGRAADGSWVYDGRRRVADSPVVDVTKKMLKISTKQAGPCMGDSGGPPARRQHCSLRDVRRSEGLHRARRGLSRRHGVCAYLPRPVRHASVTPARAAPRTRRGAVPLRRTAGARPRSSRASGDSVGTARCRGASPSPHCSVRSARPRPLSPYLSVERAPDGGPFWKSNGRPCKGARFVVLEKPSQQKDDDDERNETATDVHSDPLLFD